MLPMPIPGMNLVINVSGFAEGYVPFVTIMKHEDYSVLLTTNAVSFTYTMPDFDIDVVADATPPSYNDPVTATFSLTDVTATFFKAVIEFPEAGDSEDPWEEPWEDPELNPEE